MGIILVIGGNGFIGYHVLKRLESEGRTVRCINRSIPEKESRIESVEYRIGDVFDRTFLEDSLKDVNVVLDFISTTLPNTKEISLENEINSSLRYYNYILSTLNEKGVSRYLFPSSGGAIYGSRKSGSAKETDLLRPMTPYGVGKKMAEDIIYYYGQRCGINATILRIGNVYGSQRFRKRPQGIVDVFIQNALEDKEITIWGNANSAIRDYIYLDDVTDAISKLLDLGQDGINTYNVGTGIGTSVEEVILKIERTLGYRFKKIYKQEESSGVDQIVLSIDKIKSVVGWEPRVTLDEGIVKTIEFKKRIMSI